MPTSTADKATTKTKTPTKRAAKQVASVTPIKAGKAVRGQIQTRLPQDLIDRLEVEAERRRVSKTFLVEQMIRSSLER